MSKPKPKAIIKKGIRATIAVSRTAVKKNKVTHRLAIGLRNALFPHLANTQNIYDYLRYYPTIEDYYRQTKAIESFKLKPVISIIMPTYNTPAKYLEACIDSVIIQSYPFWELCIADDASTDKEVVATLEKYAQADDRIKYTVRKTNGHISLASNSAIELASGEFVALLDHDDLLWPNALYEIVKTINERPSADFIYSDEDKINSKGDTHSFPFFKPAWSPEFLESCNYITHFSTIRKSLFESVGGFRKGYEGAQDWDLFLRVSEKTDKIYNIQKVLYSWRIHEASTAYNTDAKPYVYEAQRRLLEDHVQQSGVAGLVKQGIIKQHCSVQYQIADSPLVSIVIYADSLERTRRCVQSILNTTSYTNCEILIVTDNKSQHGTLKYAQKLSETIGHIKHIESAKTLAGPAERYNYGFRATRGKYVVWVQSYLQLTTQGWIELMLGDVQWDKVGVVGAKLVNPARSEYISAGVGMGIDGFCGDLLGGVSLQDIHYMRGLYGQSRRNVIASHSLMMAKRQTLEKLGWLSNDFEESRLTDIDLCLRLVKAGYRNIYNPYIEAVCSRVAKGNIDYQTKTTQKRLFKAKWRRYIKNDPYLNRNFSMVGAHLNIK